MAATALGKKVPAEEQVEPPIAESVHDPQQTPAWLDRWVVWLVIALALLAIAYGPQIVDQLVHMGATSPGFKVW